MHVNHANIHIHNNSIHVVIFNIFIDLDSCKDAIDTFHQFRFNGISSEHKRQML